MSNDPKDAVVDISKLMGGQSSSGSEIIVPSSMKTSHLTIRKVRINLIEKLGMATLVAIPSFLSPFCLPLLLRLAFGLQNQLLPVLYN